MVKVHWDRQESKTTPAFCRSRRVLWAMGMLEVGVEEDHIEIPEGKTGHPPL